MMRNLLLSVKLAVQRVTRAHIQETRIEAHRLFRALRSVFPFVTQANTAFDENERALVLLNALGDAIVASDVKGCVTYLNAAAENMTGWSQQEAAGKPVTDVLRIINSGTRVPLLSPIALAILENKTLCLTPNSSLIRRDGFETAIEDSASPIRDRHGKVIGAVMVLRDVSTARALSLRMSYLAEHDSLTGLPNRTVLNDRLNQSLALAHRHQKQMAVLFLDVDRFKQVNDSCGHDIGDRLLQSIAERLVSCVRASDTVSRLGGDEFVILLSEVAHARDAAVSATKILVALSIPHRIEHRSLSVTASIGIVIHPQDGNNVDALLKHADSAMYHAKNRGRNNFQFFGPTLNAQRPSEQGCQRRQGSPRREPFSQRHSSPE